VATGAYDRERKPAAYARAGVPEYWVVDPTAGAVEVFRDPTPEGYAAVRRLGRQDAVTPPVAPDRPVAVRDLLP
jgi:Uma2 family endonuclease